MFFEPMFCERLFSLFFVFLGLLLGPSWGTLGGKSCHFGTLWGRFPERMPVWCHLGTILNGFGSTLGAFSEDLGIIL